MSKHFIPFSNILALKNKKKILMISKHENKIIAIGALGGSGTRTVAKILMDAGIYMGDDLNYPNDNLLFTRLFRNPQWYLKADTDEINKRLAVFKKYMQNEALSVINIIEIIRAAKENPSFDKDYRFYLKILFKNLRSKKINTTWGWKEPNTQVLIDEIYAFFPHIRYIHVLRHGLDMAFSNNISQLKNWGFKFNIFLNGGETKEEIACKQLDYWILSTQKVLKQRERMGNKFYLLKHHNLYENPKIEVDKLLDFVGLNIDPNLKEKLYSLPKRPQTTERFKNYKLEIFRKDQLDFVKEMGFKI
jgi:hypothetical protein